MTQLVSIEEEIYTHEILWRSADELIKRIEAESPSPDKLMIPALLMLILACEAFVNFLGYVVRPELWADEKVNFKGKGLEAKLEAIVERAPSFQWKKGGRPYQLVRALETFRDMAAHGKVQCRQYKAKREENGLHFQFRHEWDQYLNPEKLREARCAVQAFAQSLVVALRPRYQDDHPHLIFDAFSGSIASAIGTTAHGA